MVDHKETPPAGASDAAIAQAFREFGLRNCVSEPKTSTGAWEWMRNRAAEIDALTSKAEGGETIGHRPYDLGRILYMKETGGTEYGWETLSSEKRQGWMNRATPPAQVAGSGMGDERAAFDTWFRQQNDLPVNADTTNIDFAYLPWRAWKHRAALAAQPAPVADHFVGVNNMVQPAPVVGGDGG